ncbi:hypothetical protein, partial [Gardnerella vaginalis]|uniref:hypothetical protein n=1 Tax=Gardnerella vaginalis TaxID=2702 RepID=UPI001E536DFC
DAEISLTSQHQKPNTLAKTHRRNSSTTKTKIATQKTTISHSHIYKPASQTPRKRANDYA